MAEQPKENPAVRSEQDLPKIILGMGQAMSYLKKPEDTATEELKEDAKLLERLCSLTPFTGPPPVDFSKTDERPFGKARRDVLNKANEVLVYVRDHPKGTGNDVELVKMLKEYRELEKAYDEARIDSSMRAIDRLMKDGKVDAKYRSTVVELVSRQSAFSPPTEALFDELSEAHSALHLQFTSLWMKAVFLKPGDTEFAKDIEEYAKAKEKYEAACAEKVKPTFIKGINKSNNPEGQAAFDWDYLYKEFHASLPMPETQNAPKEVETYLKAEYRSLIARQRDIERSVQVYTSLLRKGEDIPAENYRNMLRDVVLFVIDANEYRADVSNAPENTDKKKKFMALLALAGIMQFVDKKFLPRTGPLTVLKPEKVKELQAAYEKVKAEFQARGLNPARLPPFEEVLQVKANGVLRGATSEIWRSISHLGPLEVVMLSLALYFSDDKIKGGSEFMMVMAGFGGMNALGKVLGAARTHQMMSVAMFGEGSKVGRGVASAAKWFVRMKGPPVVKVIAGTAAIVGFHEELEEAGGWVSDNVAHGWARKFGEDFLHALGGPVLDAAGSLEYRTLGVKAEGEDPALRFLIEKRSDPIILKFCRTPEEFNRYVEKAIQKTSASKVEFYRLEKIDLADDYKKDVDVSRPVDPNDVTEKGKFEDEYGEYGKVKDWRESRWVARMGLRVRAIHAMLVQDREALQAEIAARKINAPAVPALENFVTNGSIPVDFKDGLDVKEQLKRVSDSSGNIGSYTSTRFEGMEGAAGIQSFDKAIRKFAGGAESENLSSKWKNYITKAGQLADMVSLFRYMGIYNQKYWLEDQEFARKGAVSEMEYMVRKNGASERDARNIIPPLDELFKAKERMKLPPRKDDKKGESDEGPELRHYRKPEKPKE